jgi:CRISPR-associated protein Cmr6
MVMSNAQQVSMMFRAQVDGRCQVHRIDPDRDQDDFQDCEIWANEWVKEASEHIPEFGDEIQTQDAQISWRFITNSGQDAGVIRPVIGARGIPFYPGSSMKGAFRKACHQRLSDRVDRYCGDRETLSPGILRFHGSYPTSNAWTKNLVDIVHPQQGWQVQNVDTRERDGGAFAQISLYQPELRFGISSTIDLPELEWAEIWTVWQVALSNGIGCRVSAGYGKPVTKPEAPLYTRVLTGQGAASLLIDRTPEFRPNIFRAAVRGHALRIFGGLTDAATANAIVDRLFGGIQGDVVWGLLSMEFRELQPFKTKRHGWKGHQYHYTMKGELTWGLTQAIGSEKEESLKKLVSHLMRFAMVLGGFGKGWRRIDHRKFYSNETYDKLIGCHWTWRDPVFMKHDPEDQLNEVASLINRVQGAAEEWMRLWGYEPNRDGATSWREAWCKERAQVWGRKAEHEEDSVAIKWLHQGYDEVLQGRDLVQTKQLRKTVVAGFLGDKHNPTRIGRLWHRMYPVIRRVTNSNGQKSIAIDDEYLELLTFFPDKNNADSKAFSNYLNSDKNRLFKRIW